MAEPKQHSILRSASVVSAAVLLSRITGLIRETLLASLFGAGQTLDAFIMGIRIPNLTRDLFAEGALSSAFVPVFTQQLAKSGKAEAARLFNLVATAILLVVGGICILGIVFTPELVRLFAGGFAKVPGKFELAVSLTRIMFPFLVLVALAAQAMGVLNACNQFGIPALSSSFFNVGSMIFGLFAGYMAGPYLGIAPVTGMAYGVLFGGVLQLFVQVPSLARHGFVFRPDLHFDHPGVRQMLRLMGPAALGNAAVQINVMVNSSFAASITDAAGRVISGPVSWLNCAFRFMQLPLGLFGVAIASATLPSISRSAAAADMNEFRHVLSRSLAMVFLLTVPSSVGLAVLSESIVGAVYEYHRFSAFDTHQTALALACYAVGLAGYAAIKILAPAFYALGDARVPMAVSLVSVAINYAAASSLIRLAGLGHLGLALSTSTVALFGFLVLFEILRRRIGGLEGRALLASTLKILAASAAMAVAAGLSSRFIRSSLGTGKTGQFTDLLISIPLACAVFYVACRGLHLPELEDVTAMLGQRLGIRRVKLR